MDFESIKREEAKLKNQTSKQKEWAEYRKKRDGRLKESKDLSDSIDLSLITSALSDYKQVRSKLLSECPKKKRGKSKKAEEEEEVKPEKAKPIKKSTKKKEVI